jgi:hypothetical protein
MDNNTDPGTYYDAYQSANAATSATTPQFDAGAHYDAYIQNQIGNSSLPGSTSNPGLSNSAYNASQSATPTAITAAKLDPDFTQKLDMINTGASRALAQFTTGILGAGAAIGSKFGMPDEQVNALKEGIKNYNAAYDAEQQKNIATYNGSYPEIGSFIGNVAATLPVAGLYGKVASLGSAAADAIGGGLGTAAKYGVNAVGGALTSAGIEGMKYDPNNPNAGLFNTAAAKQVLKDPLAYAIPAALTRGPGWVQDANALKDAQAIIPNITNANVTPTVSPVVRAINKGLSVVSNITGTGNGISQLRDIGGPVSNFVQQVSGLPTKMGSEDLINYAGKQVQTAVQSLEKQKNDLWDQVPMDNYIQDPDGIKSLAKTALGLMKGTEIPGEKLTTANINNIINPKYNAVLNDMGQPMLETPNLTVGDAKQLQSYIGTAAKNAFGMANGAGIDLGKGLLAIKNGDAESGITGIIDHMQDSMSSSDMEAFSAARQQSSLLRNFKNNSPLAAQAITDEVSARNLVRNIIGTPKQYDNSNSILDVMNPAGNPGGLSAPNALAQKSMAAAKLAQVMQQSNKPGGLDINQFLTNTQNDQTLAPLMGSDPYKSFQGLSQLMKNIQDNSIGTGKSWTVGGALGALGAAGAVMGHPAASAAATASYLLANYVANSSPMKNLFNTYINPNISNSLKGYLENKIMGQLNNAGFQLHESGVFNHKGEIPLSQQQPQGGQ